MTPPRSVEEWAQDYFRTRFTGTLEELLRAFAAQETAALRAENEALVAVARMAQQALDAETWQGIPGTDRGRLEDALRLPHCPGPPEGDAMIPDAAHGVGAMKRKVRPALKGTGHRGCWKLYDEQQAEIRRLREESNRPKCLYCSFGEDALFSVEDLKQHIEKECDAHPLRKTVAALAAHQAVVRELGKALDRCDGNRGAFSCHEPHDLRCPKSRADTPEEWHGEWRCDCGRDALNAALAHPLVVAAREAP